MMHHQRTELDCLILRNPLILENPQTERSMNPGRHLEKQIIAANSHRMHYIEFAVPISYPRFDCIFVTTDGSISHA